MEVQQNGHVVPSSPSSSSPVDQLWSKSVELEKEQKILLKKKTVFDKNVVQIRNSLKTIYEQIIFTDYEFASSREVETLLWKSVFYKVIEEYRKRLRKLQNSKEAEATKLSDSFANFLESSMKFYNSLILKFKNRFNLKLDGSIDYKIDSKDSNVHKSFLSCHRCLIFLGDLSRYHRDLLGNSQENWVKAGQYYCQALYMVPDHGNPHNQLAVLGTYVDDDFMAIYHYFRSLTVLHPFPTARDNLIVLFEKNRMKLKDLEEKKEEKEEEKMKLFLILFVRLHGILFTKTSPEKFEGIVRQISPLFNEILFQIFNSANVDLELETFSETCLKMVAINISAIHKVLQEKGNGCTETSSQGTYLEYSLLLSFTIFSKLTLFAHDFFVQLFPTPSPNFFAMFLGTIGIFMDFIQLHPEFILRTISKEESEDPERKLTLKLLKESILNSIKLANFSLGISRKFKEKYLENSEKISLKEELELRGFTPLQKYRNLPFDGRIITNQKISEEELKSQNEKRLRKFVEFCDFLSGIKREEKGENTEEKYLIYFDEQNFKFSEKKPIYTEKPEVSPKIQEDVQKLQEEEKETEEEEEGESLLNTLNALSPLEDEEGEFLNGSGNILDEEEEEEIFEETTTTLLPPFKLPETVPSFHTMSEREGIEMLSGRNYNQVGALAPNIQSSGPKSSGLNGGIVAIGSGRTTSPPLMLLGENHGSFSANSSKNQRNQQENHSPILGFSFDSLFPSYPNSNQNSSFANSNFQGNFQPNSTPSTPKSSNPFLGSFSQENQPVSNNLNSYFPSSAPQHSAIYASNHNLNHSSSNSLHSSMSSSLLHSIPMENNLNHLNSPNNSNLSGNLNSYFPSSAPQNSAVYSSNHGMNSHSNWSGLNSNYPSNNGLNSMNNANLSSNGSNLMMNGGNSLLHNGNSLLGNNLMNNPSNEMRNTQFSSTPLSFAWNNNAPNVPNSNAMNQFGTPESPRNSNVNAFNANHFQSPYSGGIQQPFNGESNHFNASNAQNLNLNPAIHSGPSPNSTPTRSTPPPGFRPGNSFVS